MSAKVEQMMKEFTALRLSQEQLEERERASKKRAHQAELEVLEWQQKCRYSEQRAQEHF